MVLHWTLSLVCTNRLTQSQSMFGQLSVQEGRGTVTFLTRNSTNTCTSAFSQIISSLPPVCTSPFLPHTSISGTFYKTMTLSTRLVSFRSGCMTTVCAALTFHPIHQI